ncbi:DUF2007 domain-containing protein [Psychrosphaera haliotis]|uniref:RanBP2-type domain-containing protein n=1 Tax=Psychrosphaera haliotis TaxID=555083 RepID=A0A6N8F9R6_9GAMM|nr:DUF2007 domain-containing protein [Psychrosphaera haliotis]MUH71817.1 hypothetical protein [Psychrosphaera haliotis]
MKKVYQCSNNLELQPFIETLKRLDIKHLVKNEYISGAIGELPFTEAWPQLWVLNDSDLDSARSACKAIEQELKTDKPDWNCTHCGEENHANFEFCWQCEQLDVHQV